MRTGQVLNPPLSRGASMLAIKASLATQSSTACVKRAGFFSNQCCRWTSGLSNQIALSGMLPVAFLAMQAPGYALVVPTKARQTSFAAPTSSRTALPMLLHAHARCGVEKVSGGILSQLPVTRVFRSLTTRSGQKATARFGPNLASAVMIVGVNLVRGPCLIMRSMSRRTRPARMNARQATSDTQYTMAGVSDAPFTGSKW